MTGILQSVTGVIAGDNGQGIFDYRRQFDLHRRFLESDNFRWKSFDAALKKVDNNRKIAVFGIGKHVVR